MKLYRQQRGISAIGLLLLLAIVALVVMVGLRLTPVYIEHYSITSTLNSLARAEAETMRSPADIRQRLDRLLAVNSVRDLQPEDVMIEHRGGGLYEVIVAYEVRTRFVGNIDFVVSFDERVEVVTE